MRTLTASYSGLAPLGDEFAYEGWLITDEGPVSSGRFEVVNEATPPADKSGGEFDLG